MEEVKAGVKIQPLETAQKKPRTTKKKPRNSVINKASYAINVMGVTVEAGESLDNIPDVKLEFYRSTPDFKRLYNHGVVDIDA